MLYTGSGRLAAFSLQKRTGCQEHPYSPKEERRSGGTKECVAGPTTENVGQQSHANNPLPNGYLVPDGKRDIKKGILHTSISFLAETSAMPTGKAESGCLRHSSVEVERMAYPHTRKLPLPAAVPQLRIRVSCNTGF